MTTTGRTVAAQGIAGRDVSPGYVVGGASGAAGLLSTVDVDDVVSFRYIAEQTELVVAAIQGGAGEWEGGPESEARLRDAIDSKIPVMGRAGEAG